MDFDMPAEGLTFEGTIAREAERMKARREKAAERRRARHDGFWDEQTVEVSRPDGPRLCSEPSCGRTHHGRGLCSVHLKRQRRSRGLAN